MQEQEQTVHTGPGWYPDPYFLNHERYWDGKWTDDVRLIERSPIAGTPEADPSETAAAGSGRRTSHATTNSASGDTATNPVVHEDDTLTVPTVPRPDDTATVPTVTPEDPTLAVPAAPGKDAERRDIGGAVAGATAGTAGAQTNRRRLLFAGVALVLVVVVVVAVVALAGGSNGNGPTKGSSAEPQGDAPPAVHANDPSAVKSVTAAASTSVRQKSVTVSIDQTLSGAGGSSTQQGISGGGAFYVQTGLGTMTLALPGEPVAEAQHYVFDGATTYVNVASSPVPGKNWVVARTTELPPAQGSVIEDEDFISTIGNPGLLLRHLTNDSVSASYLGSTMVDGASVRRYAVSLPLGRKTVNAGYGTTASEEVDIGTDHVVHQILITTKTSVNGQPFAEHIVVVFSGWGAPLFVGPPPAGQLITLAQYASGLTSGA